MQNLTLGDKIAGKLSCLCEHYMHRQFLDPPPGCNGCDWTEICNKIMLLIKENV